MARSRITATTTRSGSTSRRSSDWVMARLTAATSFRMRDTRSPDLLRSKYAMGSMRILP